MTDDEKFYLAVAKEAFETIVESNLPVLMSHVPERGFLYLFDMAYAMGFGACRQMVRDGIDIEALHPEELSLVRKSA